MLLNALLLWTLKGSGRRGAHICYPLTRMLGGFNGSLDRLYICQALDLTPSPERCLVSRFLTFPCLCFTFASLCLCFPSLCFTLCFFKSPLVLPSPCFYFAFFPYKQSPISPLPRALLSLPAPARRLFVQAQTDGFAGAIYVFSYCLLCELELLSFALVIR